MGIDPDAGVPLSVPLFLTLRNDKLGEAVKLNYRQLNGTIGEYGNLGAGETFTVSLAQVLGVFAIPVQGDTHVECYLSCSSQSL